MKKILSPLIFIITVGLLFNIGCDDGVNNFVSLEASRIEDVSSFNGLTDSSWDLINGLTVYVDDSFCMMGRCGNFGDQKKVSIKAQYSDTHVYMLFHWPDSDKSMNTLNEITG